jgi:hypothetical protein
MREVWNALGPFFGVKSQLVFSNYKKYLVFTWRLKPLYEYNVPSIGIRDAKGSIVVYGEGQRIYTSKAGGGSEAVPRSQR